MTVAAMATPFVALRRALRSLLPRRSALAAGAGIPPRFAGLATRHHDTVVGRRAQASGGRARAPRGPGKA